MVAYVLYAVLLYALREVACMLQFESEYGGVTAAFLLSLAHEQPTALWLGARYL